MKFQNCTLIFLKGHTHGRTHGRAQKQYAPSTFDKVCGIKSMCLPYLKFSDSLPKTHYFVLFGLIDDRSGLDKYHHTGK